jgi:transmembrane sensor
MSPTENFGPIEERIRVEAADWFARMRGPEADALRPAFELWYATPAHKRAYEQLVGRWEQSAFIGASRAGRERYLPRASFVARHPGWSAAAALVAFVSVAGLFVTEYRGAMPRQSANAPTPVRYESGAAIREVALSDGSRLTLDKASLVLVSYSPTRRALTLERGRARFRAVRDVQRPFVVQAGTGQIASDGTVFDITLYGQTALINAVDGSVLVQSRASVAPARLVLASQQILVPASAALPDAVPAASDSVAWLSRMITLDHSSLGDAATQVGRGARTKILFVDDASALRITGSFERGDVEGLARAAQAIFPLRRTRDPSGNIILALDPKAVRK